MLIGACAGAEPTVVGEVEQPAGPLAAACHERPIDVTADVIVEPARPLAARNRVAGKDDLVADQRQEVGRSRNALIAAPIAGDEAAVHLGELQETEPLEQAL